MVTVTDLVTVTTLEIPPSIVYSSVWSKEVLLVHGHPEIIHGRATWTIGMDELHCSGVPMHYPFFGRFFVQTALLALDESLDDQEMGLSSCFPISCPFVQGVVQDIVVILEKVLFFCEPRVAKPLVGRLCRFHFPKNLLRVIL